MSELVSCVMATKDRPGFFRIALACFLGQTYLNSELTVVDDGAERVATMCAGLDRVRYVGLTTTATIGTKLNIGIEAARGPVIQKGEDQSFIRDIRPHVVRVCAPEQYVLVRHGRNTWTETKSGDNVDDRLRLLSWDERKLDAVVDSEAAAFYRSFAVRQEL